MRGSSSSDYEETIRLVGNIKTFEAKGFGKGWDQGYLAECLRGSPETDTAAWLVYSLINEEGFDNTEFISAIARRHRAKLWWWLKYYADDTRQDEQLREFAKDYLLPSCSYCGALRVATNTCHSCGRAVSKG